MKEELVTIKTFDGFDLKAAILLPEKTNKIAVMCHGITCNKEEYLGMFNILAKKLSEYNIGSLRFDFRGHGESSGVDLDFDVVSQLIDLKSVMHWIKTIKGFLNASLSFVGASFGGAPGIIAQNKFKYFDSISLFAPVLSYYETFVHPTTKWGIENFNSKAWEESKKNGHLLLDGNFKISTRLLEEFLLIDPLETIKNITIPIQIFHGTKDDYVPCKIAETLANQYPHFSINIVPDMGHGLYIDGDDDGNTKDSKQIQDNYFELTRQFVHEA
ncbi:MAG: alpha/beta hydrolase [Treponema sp.]|jgi:pimeloyl-ACP methyl ester carboxylesterase|nr:alpha/beta hydrolase [Treponema sp.]